MLICQSILLWALWRLLLLELQEVQQVPAEEKHNALERKTKQKRSSLPFNLATRWCNVVDQPTWRQSDGLSSLSTWLSHSLLTMWHYKKAASCFQPVWMLWRRATETTKSRFTMQTEPFSPSRVTVRIFFLPLWPNVCLNIFPNHCCLSLNYTSCR